MTVDMRLEFEDESDGLSGLEKLRADVRFRAALFILPDGRMLEFDRYLAELKATRDRERNRR